MPADAKFPDKFYDYYESYRTKGVSALIIYIFREITRDLDSYVVFENGVLRQFYHPDIDDHIAKETLNICQDEYKFENYKNEYPQLLKEGQELFDGKLSKKEISKPDLEEVIDYFNRFGQFFLQLDFGDKSYKKYFDNLGEEEEGRFRQLQDLKNKARENIITPYIFDSFNSILDIMSEQFSVSKGELNWYTLPELFDLYKNKTVDLDKIKSRSELCIVYCYDHVVDIVEYEQSVEILKKLNKDNHVEQIKGTVAYKSAETKVVTGEARIFKMDFSDKAYIKRFCEDFREGDVLVSDVTTPELLPAMQKAAAIVTDLGGMMTHAAIIARELKIPCIVNARIAVKVLNDGDVIEINTKKGTIERISE